MCVYCVDFYCCCNYGLDRLIIIIIMLLYAVLQLYGIITYACVPIDNCNYFV